MSGLAFDTIESLTGGRWVVEPGPDDPAPVGVAIDSRELHRGQTFVAFVGERVDGHGYLEQAQALRAALCIVTQADKVPKGFGIPTLVVEDPTAAMTAMASRWRSLLKGTVIGVTGSNGKTTTTRLIHAVLNQAGQSWVSSKSHNNAIGVPMSILNAPLDAEYVIFELGTSSPGEIERRADLVRPDIAAITSIGRAHLEELGSIQGVCTEKASILKYTSRLAIVPSGVLDETIQQLDLECAIESMCHDRIGMVELGERSVAFDLDGHRFTVPVPGEHNASNAAMAVLIGRVCGMNDVDIAAGLEQATLPEMRLDRVEIPTKADSIVVYNDAYNANPDSARAALAFFEALQTDANKVVVLGDMLELGSATDAEHASLLADLDTGIGRVVLVGSAFAKACGLHTDVFAGFDDHAMTEIARSIEPGDVVLLKGSRGIGLERLVYILINRHTPFAGRGRGLLVEDANES